MFLAGTATRKVPGRAVLASRVDVLLKSPVLEREPAMVNFTENLLCRNH